MPAILRKPYRQRRCRFRRFFAAHQKVGSQLASKIAELATAHNDRLAVLLARNGIVRPPGFEPCGSCAHMVA